LDKWQAAAERGNCPTYRSEWRVTSSSTAKNGVNVNQILNLREKAYILRSFLTRRAIQKVWGSGIAVQLLEFW
jgi:hypothetical protein